MNQIEIYNKVIIKRAFNETIKNKQDLIKLTIDVRRPEETA